MSGFSEKLLSSAGKDAVLFEEPMKNHTTFRIGGNADFFVMPDSAGKVREIISLCREEGIPFFVMGNGSDLLVSDTGFRGVVIEICRRMSRIEVQGTQITAQAGALLSQIAAEAVRHSLTGFEFAGGIPGTLGGACFMNAGAYGGEMKDILVSAEVLTADGQILNVPAAEMAFGYRTSAVREKGEIVLSAVLSLSEGNPEEIAEKSETFRSRRQAKQPLEMPSAGSTFKRPAGYFAGKLIMDAGLCGCRVGGAQVSEKHCGFIVNCGNATAADVRALICHVQDTVMEKFQVRLEPEVRFLGVFEEEKA